MKYILSLLPLLALCTMHAGDNKSTDRNYLHDGKLLKVFLYFNAEKRTIESSFNTHDFAFTAYYTETVRLFKNVDTQELTIKATARGPIPVNSFDQILCSYGWNFTPPDSIVEILKKAAEEYEAEMRNDYPALMGQN